MSRINDIIAGISPKWALRRQMNAIKYQAARHYEASSHGRLAKSFKNAYPIGPNADLQVSLHTLLERSRYLYKNNNRIGRAVQVIADNTVGEGIRPAPTGTKNQNKTIIKLWNSWAGETVCDWNEYSTFYGFQDMVVRELVVAGECFIIRRRTNDDIPIRLELIQSEQIDTSRNYVNELGYARLGIQYSKTGQLIGYWLYPYHPYDFVFSLNNPVSQLVRKEDCLHVFRATEAGQLRGVPMGVQAFMKTNMLDDYDTATLEKQRVSAAMMAFVTGSQEPDKDKPAYIAPGQIAYLGEDETINFTNPPSVSDYDAYTRALLRGIAASYNITYESLTMDYSNVNFTSGRMGKIDVTPGFRKLQYNILAPQLCAPVWKWFVDALIMVGKVKIGVGCGAQDWTAPRVQQLDPVKETNAQVTKLQYGLTTFSEIQRENGNDPDDVIGDIVTDQNKFSDNNINFPLMKGNDNKTNNK